MRSDLVDSLLRDVEGEDIGPLTDTALGDDIVELRRLVDRIELQSTPWWWQPPFPVT